MVGGHERLRLLARANLYFDGGLKSLRGESQDGFLPQNIAFGAFAPLVGICADKVNRVWGFSKELKKKEKIIITSIFLFPAPSLL
jgi:hypothetical protein